jgi:hypothetical protein
VAVGRAVETAERLPKAWIGSHPATGPDKPTSAVARAQGKGLSRQNLENRPEPAFVVPLPRQQIVRKSQQHLPEAISLTAQPS